MAEHLEQLGVGTDEVGVIVGRQTGLAARRMLQRRGVAGSPDRHDANAPRQVAALL